MKRINDVRKKIKIIIAEDFKYFIEGLVLLLIKCTDCEIIDICNDGKELIDSPKLPYADLILSDIEMPNINGIEAARQINFKYPHIPMIALTMHIENVFLENIIKAGFKGFVYKPEVAQQLYTVIKKVLDNKFVFPKILKIKD